MARTKSGSRSSFGQIIISHKGKKIPTSVGSKEYEGLFGGEKSTILFNYDNGKIPNGYAHRPELMSNLFLGSANLWWIICERNAIFDVFEQLNPGDYIKIPKSL